MTSVAGSLSDRSLVSPRRAWLAFWGAWRRYHRYEVRGIEHLDGPGARLIVGYHGRPIAYDLCMLSVTLNERLGYLPHGIAHRYAGENALLRWVLDDLGFVTGDGDAIARAVVAGEHIAVQPGGTREGCRSHAHRYEVDWGRRTGYVRLAMKYRLPIVPVAASGIDDGYVGLNDGHAWGKRVGMPGGLPLWLGVGPLGFWPFSPPFPVKIIQWIGAPIDPFARGEADPNDADRIADVHEEVRAAVQSLLDRANRAPKE